MVDIYKQENLPLEISGKVVDVVVYKGGNVSLDIMKNDGSRQEVAVSNKLQQFIKKGDIFTKEKNSNRCFIVRHDSLIYLDCYNIPRAIRDSIGAIDEWPENKKNHWQSK
jgi:hypothetical protein